MSGNRYALIIANDEYEDDSFNELDAPQFDAYALAKVLGDPETSNFYVQLAVNKKSHTVNQLIETFYDNRKRDDLLLLYFSGHGVKDEDGRLYFATPNTKRNRLMSTAISAYFVNEQMRRTRSRSQILLLDCCYSGAFAKGMIAKSGSVIGSIVGTNEQFQGRGRVVITASDSMQYAFEDGELVEQGPVNSIFTKAIVEGISTWEADRDGDNRISVHELYDYVDGYVQERTPNQQPVMWSFNTQGEMIIAERDYAPEMDDEVKVNVSEAPDFQESKPPDHIEQPPSEPEQPPEKIMHVDIVQEEIESPSQEEVSTEWVLPILGMEQPPVELKHPTQPTKRTRMVSKISGKLLGVGFLIALLGFSGLYIAPIFWQTEEIHGYYDRVSSIKSPDHLISYGEKIYSIYLVPTNYKLTYDIDPAIEWLKIRILDPDQKLVTEVSLNEEELLAAASNPEDNVILFGTGKVGTHSIGISIQIPVGYDRLGVMYNLTKWSTITGRVYPLVEYTHYFTSLRNIGIMVFVVDLILIVYERLTSRDKNR